MSIAAPSGMNDVPKRNYGFEKRQKELNKQSKREEKRQRKLERATEAPEETPGEEATEPERPADDRDR
ncbi:MAG TPA: hypothetical protein VMY76_06655 [Gemmatimonadales bacterium]|nr:hypothetical protein [Gemmatimonadales bacterium]